MTREEAIEVLQASSIKQMSLTKIIVDGKSLSVKVALDMAIKALEQEPFMATPCISSKVCEHDRVVTLDKIRAEIDGLKKDSLISWASSEMIISTILNIIDKYKAESEE